MKIKINIADVMILFGVLTLLFYSSDPVIRTDSFRYLSGSLLDPPMYTKIISILQKLFGTLKSVIVFQTLSIGFGIIYFTRTMSNIFDSDNITKILVSFFYSFLSCNFIITY
jgi:4-amino-4-deoxy-L-arabinose transferase-like glycosyltransferase